MITKIGYDFNLRNNYYNKPVSKPQFATTISPLTYDQFISFTGDSKRSQKAKLNQVLYMAPSDTMKMLHEISDSIEDSPNPAITPMHIINKGLHITYDYMKALDENKVVYSQDKVPPMAAKFFGNTFSYKIYSDDDLRSKVEPIIKEYLDRSEAIIKESENNKTKANKKFKLFKSSNNGTKYDGMIFSDKFVDYAFSYVTDSENQIEKVADFTLFAAFANSGDNAELDDFNNSLLAAIASKITLVDDNERRPFTGYQKKADDVITKVILGSNIFLTYDDNAIKPYPFLDTVYEALKSKQGGTIKLIEFDSEAPSTQTPDYCLGRALNEIRANKDDDYIIVLNPMVYTKISDYQKSRLLPANFHSLLNNLPDNARLLLFAPRDEFYSYSSDSLFNGFSEVSIPNLTEDEMLRFFNQNSKLLDDYSDKFHDDALESIIKASYNISGAFPEKTFGLINNIENYYSESSDKITVEQVENYLSEANRNGVLKQTDDNSSVKVVLDTGKHLSDFLGKDSTKKDAQLLVDQIVNGDLGTKGVLIYSQDGSVGAGRHFTAKAIAGEAQVPYIETNALDFGTKDVEIFGDQMSPDASMKKLFSLVKSKAEVNPHKSAVLFIDNFEFFSVSELLSPYHQKAMAQLLREMEKAQNAGLNILVVGSVPSPRYVGEAAKKSFKFNDTISVASPDDNDEARKAIILKALEDNNINLAKDDYDRILKFAIDLTDYNSYIEIKSFIKKAKSVAQERGHEEITKADLTEACLQLEFGRPTGATLSEHRNRIVTSHECGHAVNMEVINQAAKALKKPWHVPNRANYITLDSRGYFGGCVMPGKDTNEEESFEHIFSSLVFMYGGYSVEKYFYGMDGSWGITMDMKNAARYASMMVRKMGMGPTVGTVNVESYSNCSDKMKEMIENDERVIVNNAKAISDMITRVYAGFNERFTEKYAHLAGTGDCAIDGDEFREMLQEWRSEQSPEKQAELAKCDEAIFKIMDATKKGIMVRRTEE